MIDPRTHMKTKVLIEKLVAFLVEERRLCPRYGGDDRYAKLDSLIAEARAALNDTAEKAEDWANKSKPPHKDKPYEIVAYMHDWPGRVDCIHAEARELWLKVQPKQVEHYTIPLIRLPLPMSTDRAKELMRETLGVENISDGNLIKLLRAIEAAHGITGLEK